MSMSKLVSQVTSNFNDAHEAYYDHYLGYWENGGIDQAMCRATVQTILDSVACKLATERQLNLSLFGKFSVLDEASLEPKDTKPPPTGNASQMKPPGNLSCSVCQP